MASPRRTPAEARLLRATKRFRCRTCGELVRAKWDLPKGERLIEEHGTNTERCPRSGRLVEVALFSERDEMARLV